MHEQLRLGKHVVAFGRLPYARLLGLDVVLETISSRSFISIRFRGLLNFDNLYILHFVMGICHGLRFHTRIPKNWDLKHYQRASYVSSCCPI
jgi:hypothetical protein